MLSFDNQQNISPFFYLNTRKTIMTSLSSSSSSPSTVAKEEEDEEASSVPKVAEKHRDMNENEN